MKKNITVKHGSVKDIEIIGKPSSRKYAYGNFVYTDRYSVFNWAHEGYRMPDEIPDKGVAQCLMASYFFEKIENMGVPTTYLGLMDPKRNNLFFKPVLTNRMKILAARVIEPKDMANKKKSIPSYKEFQKDVRGAVVPAEFMFRFGLPEGSSAFRRMRSGQLDPRAMHLKNVPSTDEPIWFGFPVLDYSTKFDPRGDVYDLGRENYRKMCGLSELELYFIDSTTRSIAYLLAKEYERLGMKLWDGKLEYVFAPGQSRERKIVLGDVAGALDEVRVLKGEQQRSKEFGRQYYRKTQPDWVAACSEEEKKGGDWQSRLTEKGLVPKPMPNNVLDLFSGIYTSIANALWDQSIIPGAPMMKQVDKEYEKFLKSLKA